MIERTIQVSFPHRVRFVDGAFEPSNPALVSLLAEGGDGLARVLFVVDGGVVSVLPGLVGEIEAYCAAHVESLEMAGVPMVVPGGEACKNDWRLVESIWEQINLRALDRHSYVIAVGGGAVLDLVGLAAATAHRGIRHVRMPTTTLSQADGGVGVKNGVNYFGKKNWVGTFSVPHGIVNDFRFIRVLPRRDKRAGVIEAIKVSLIKDRGFFEEMESRVDDLAALEDEILKRVIQRSADLHIDHIVGGGDPFEYGSARPLDFGHWVAHKLEQISGFSLRHGEAVAIGMAVDLRYSALAGLLDPQTCERVLRLIEGVGFAVSSKFLDARDAAGRRLILLGLEEFREHLGGELTVTMVPAIGKKVEIHEMDDAVVGRVIDHLTGATCGAGHA